MAPSSRSCWRDRERVAGVHGPYADAGVHASEGRCSQVPLFFACACCRRIWPVILKTKLGVHAVITAERMADSQPINEDISDLTSHLWYESFSWIDGFKKEKENQVMSHATGAAHDTLESEDVFLGKASRESMVDPNLLSAHWNVAWTVAHSLRESDQDEAKVEEYYREL